MGKTEFWNIGITEDISVDDEVSQWRTAILSNGSEVAAVYDPSENKVVRRAHLIAAAPSMLRALEALLVSVENYTSLNKPPDQWDEYDVMMAPRWAVARAVIARAKGEHRAALVVSADEATQEGK